jgi:hypothetical protein
MSADRKTGSSVPGKTYRLGATAPDRIRLLLDDRRIKEQEFAQADVAAVWQKAAESARDASLGGLSVDSAIRLAYDAGHLGALACGSHSGHNTAGKSRSSRSPEFARLSLTSGLRKLPCEAPSPL